MSLLTKIGLLVCSLFAFSPCGINAVRTQEEQVNSAWALVGVQYQRRADLIPNLASAVKGAAAQELEVFSRVTELRAGAARRLPQSFSETGRTDPQKLQLFLQQQANLESGLGRLLAVGEAYPELKPNQNFLALQSQIEGSENRVAVARRDFALAIERYNVTFKTFPGVLWKKRLYPSAESIEQYFESQKRSDSAPVVEF